MRNCNVVSDNAPLITKTIIPPEILPISITVSNFVHHLIGLSILLVVMVMFYSIHLSALYRNHHFITHGYGNYIGLGRLMRFVAREVNYQVGELLTISTHADAELHLGRLKIEEGVKRGKELLDSLNTTDRETIARVV